MSGSLPGCDRFEFTVRWPQIGFPLTQDKRALLESRDREIEEWLNRCRCKCGNPTCPPFEFTVRWSQIPDELDDEAIALLENHDRELEQYLDVCFCACEETGGG